MNKVLIIAFLSTFLLSCTNTQSGRKTDKKFLTGEPDNTVTIKQAEKSLYRSTNLKIESVVKYPRKNMKYKKTAGINQSLLKKQESPY